MRTAIELFILESLLAKTWLEESLGSPIPHYVVSLCLLLTIIFLAAKGKLIDLRSFTPAERALLIGIIAWPIGASLFADPMFENAVAALLFALLVIGCLAAIPPACDRHALVLWRQIYLYCALATGASLVALALVPELAWGESSRFRGVLVSVAVACNVFLLTTILATFALSLADRRRQWLHGAVLGAAMAALILTKTRSTVAVAFVAISAILLHWLYRSSIYKRLIILSGTGAIACGLSLAWLTGLIGPQELYTLGEEFRLDSGPITATRELNWLLGIQRVIESPLWGEGILAKYSGGGQGGEIGLSESSYFQLYDPHSVILYLAISAGLPFLFLVCIFFVLVLKNARLLRDPQPEHLTGLVYPLVFFTLLMIPAGGSLVSFGNLVDRLWWLMLGGMAAQRRLVRKSRRLGVTASVPR